MVLSLTLLFWASAYPAIRYALTDYSATHLALFRYLVASIVLGAAALRRRPVVLRRGDWPRLAVMGLVGIALYNVGVNQGEEYVSAHATAFIMSTIPVFSVLLSVSWLGERVGRRGWLGLIVAFVGVGVIALGGAEETTSALTFNKGTLILLGAALCASCYHALQKSLLRRYDATSIATYTIWAGTVCLFVFLPGLGEAIRSAAWSSTAAVIYLGIFPAALGYYLWAETLSRMPLSRASVYTNLIPVLTLVLAFLWLGERPTLSALGGGALTLAGVLIVRQRKAKASSKSLSLTSTHLSSPAEARRPSLEEACAKCCR